MSATADLVVRVITDTSRATGLDDTAGKTSKFGKAIGTASKVAGAALLGLGAAAISAGKAAAEDAQGQALLANAMRNSAGATDAQIKSTEDWISKTAMATGVADDQLRPALGNLVRATGDVTKSQDAMGVALDVAAATGKDVEAVSKAMAKGFAGNTGAIGKLVPGLDKATLASGDMNKVMDELAAKTGGAAAAAADTTAGKMKIMALSFDEAKESLGTALLPIMSKFATVLAKVAVFLQDNSKAFTIVAAVVAVLATAIIAVNAGLAIYNAVTAVSAAVTWLLNTALLASPITWVVLGVVALVAAFVLLYKNSDTVRKAIDALWDGIKTGANAAWNAVKVAFNAILNAVKSTFNWIRGNWPLILAIITGPVGLAVLAVVRNWDRITDATRDLVSRIRQIFANLAGAIGDIVGRIREVWANAADGIRNKWGDLASAIGSIIGRIREAWGNAISAIVDRMGGLGAVLSAPFTTLRNIVNGVKDAVWGLISAVSSLIGKLSNIHWPKPPSFLSKIPGLGRAAAAPEGVAARSSAYGYSAPAVAGLGTRALPNTPSGNVIINVSGAIDPEATARQIRRILDGHTRRVGLAS